MCSKMRHETQIILSQELDIVEYNSVAAYDRIISFLFLSTGDFLPS